MSKKYSEFEQYLNPGGHLINLDDETWEEVNEYLDSDRGDELLDEVRESLKSGEFESSDNETEESDEENRSSLHRHIQCRTDQQPLQACPEGACRSFVKTKNDMGESQNAWVLYPI